MRSAPILKGISGAAVLLAFYFITVSAISGWGFALDQFGAFWYFILSLAFGFGVQIGLYSYLKSIIKHQTVSGKMVAVSGAASSVAMISCCAHYLVNILPLIGITAVISFIGQYQIEFFWVGLAANIFGIGYIASKIRKFSYL